VAEIENAQQARLGAVTVGSVEITLVDNVHGKPSSKATANARPGGLALAEWLPLSQPAPAAGIGAGLVML
jgi:hypothetical protein